MSSLGLHVPLRQRQAVDPQTGIWRDEWLGYQQAIGAVFALNDVAFAAGNFTGNDLMTWTVAEADQVTFQYALMGKRLEVAFTLRTTTVGGTPDDTLQIAIPGKNPTTGAALVAARAVTVPCRVNDNGTVSIGVAKVAAGGTVIQIQKLDGSNFAASANASGVEGVIAFEVQ
jgi:hypothetical protein